MRCPLALDTQTLLVLGDNGNEVPEEEYDRWPCSDLTSVSFYRNHISPSIHPHLPILYTWFLDHCQLIFRPSSSWCSLFGYCWQLLFSYWITMALAGLDWFCVCNCSHDNGSDRLIPAWLACQTLLFTSIRHFYLCRSYMNELSHSLNV